MKKHYPKRVVLALDIVGVDLRDLHYRLATGRIWRDYEIGLLILPGARFADAVGAIAEYHQRDRELASLPVSELLQKRYLTKKAIRDAKTIQSILHTKGN